MDYTKVGSYVVYDITYTYNPIILPKHYKLTQNENMAAMDRNSMYSYHTAPNNDTLTAGTSC